MEESVPLKGYEGLYKISIDGNVISLKRPYVPKEKTLKPSITDKGYKLVILSKNRKCKTYLLHRLIAIHFVPNKDNKPCINHKDGNKLNNNISNLEWVTIKENLDHARKNGLNKPTYGEDRSNSKLNQRLVKLIRYMYKKYPEFSYKEVSSVLGISKQGIHKVVKNQTWIKGFNENS